jgi:hypothetical protein
VDGLCYDLTFYLLFPKIQFFFLHPRFFFSLYAVDCVCALATLVVRIATKNCFRYYRFWIWENQHGEYDLARSEQALQLLEEGPESTHQLR